jgi:hypothetical protein
MWRQPPPAVWAAQVYRAAGLGGVNYSISHFRVLLEKAWRVAQAFDLAGSADVVGAPFLAYFARSGNHGRLGKGGPAVTGMASAASPPTPSASSGQALAENARLGSTLGSSRQYTFSFVFRIPGSGSFSADLISQLHHSTMISELYYARMKLA